MSATSFLLPVSYRGFVLGGSLLGFWGKLWGFVFWFLFGFFNVWKWLLQVCCYTFKVGSSSIVGYMHTLRLRVFSFISFIFHSNSIKFSQFSLGKPSVKCRHSVPLVGGRMNEIHVICKACVSAIYAWPMYRQPQETFTASIKSEGSGLSLFLFLTPPVNKWLPSCWCCCFPGASATWESLYEVTISFYITLLFFSPESLVTMI